MSRMLCPAEPWQGNYLTVNVSTVVREGNVLPVSFGLAIVCGGVVTGMQHYAVDRQASGVVLEFADGVFRRAARSDTLIVTRDADLGLRALLEAVEAFLGVEVLPLQVIDVAALDRGLEAGVRPEDGESAAGFYRRLTMLPACSPDLPGVALPDADDLPAEPLVPVWATHRRYQRHFGGRLFPIRVVVDARAG